MRESRGQPVVVAAYPARIMSARILGGVGRTLIAVGTLVLLFVAYEIWGTNLQEASAQRRLGKEFASSLAERPKGNDVSATSSPSTRSTTPEPTDPGPTTTPGTKPPELAPADLPLPSVGDPIANIEIRKIGVSKTVVQGVTLDQLKRAPGHYPETPLPGQKGNVAIAGHRTTYGAPFHNIDKLAAGDEIVVTTLQGEFRYKVDSTRIVAPSDVTVLADKGDNRLTLTACHPKYSARQRIVVSGLLVGKPVARIKGQSRIEQQGSRELAGRGDQAKRIRIDGGLDGQKASKLPALLWGGVCLLVWLCAWVLSRLVRRRTKRRMIAWIPYLVGAPVFLVVLYVFFENFSRLLPSNF